MQIQLKKLKDKVMSTNIAKSINVNTVACFGKSIKEIYKIYKIPKNERFYVESIVFKFFYKFRKINSKLEKEVMVITYASFKKFIGLCIQEINEYMDRNLSSQKVIHVFLKYFGHISLNNEDTVVFSNLLINCEKRNMTYILNQCSQIISKTNCINKCTMGTLYRFLYNFMNKRIPFELILILLSDAQKIYYYNKELFSEGSSTHKSWMMELALTSQLEEFGDIITWNDGDFAVRNEVPTEDDVNFQFMNGFRGITYSLPYMVDYFGYDNWYICFFPHKEENNKKYFKFDLNDF